VPAACEYCRLLEFATGTTFHIEHILPISEGGKTVLSNLALSCSGCNLAKGDRLMAAAGVPLFNPRHYDSALLGWYLHFDLNRETGVIAARTSLGEATIQALRMNSPSRVFARLLQIRAGLLR
jgi:hypothetical protein